MLARITQIIHKLIWTCEECTREHCDDSRKDDRAIVTMFHFNRNKRRMTVKCDTCDRKQEILTYVWEEDRYETPDEAAAGDAGGETEAAAAAEEEAEEDILDAEAAEDSGGDLLS